MTRRTTVGLAAAGLLALASVARAQEPAADPGHHGTMTQEEVKTWTAEINGKQYGVHPWAPSYEGTTGLFHMPVAYTLPKGKFSFSLFRDNLDRDPKDEDISIHGLSLGWGATDKLEIYGNFGLQNRIDADALFQAGFVNDYPFVATPWETGVGDVKLGAKYKFLDDYMGDAVGLAVRGFVKLPTADDAKGLGTGKPAFGADLVISKSLAEKADIHGSLGYQVNSDPDDVDIGNAFKWGIGLNIPACYFIQLQAELVGTNYSGGDSGFEQTNPLDLVIGPIVWFKPGFFIRPALSWNLNFNDRGLNQGSKSWTGRHISIGYHPGAACKEIYTPPPPPPPPANGNPTVSCSVERSNLLPGETTGVRATASDPDGDPLTYDWSASAGSVSGTGPAVTFNSAGMSAGSSSTITVRVSDGRNGIGSANCPVSVAAPAAPATTATCTAGGFPPNRDRLNNVDKACLDDVASRLRQDPRSTVVIIGHADKGERTPEVIARKRAEAVKRYLTAERGVDASRISVRSAGSSKPLDTGTSAAARARNRRVEVITVPEGAQAPQ
jgi:outer membrane protein OmpA-like peptidoglycan-associated protein